MIVTCPNCTTRLQLEDAKIPSRPFTVRCPKCQQIINAQPLPEEGQGGALGVSGDLPASSRAQREVRGVAAPAFRPEAASPPGAQPEAAPAPPPPGEGDLARLLAALLQRAAVTGETSHGVARRPAWELRRALVCLGSVHRDVAAGALARSHYEVFVADTTAQAVERMREDKMDVVVLDSEFDMMEQGAAFITREISALRPAERRRVIFVQLSPTARTGDAHAAFLSNFNLVVNAGDAAELPFALERTTRDLNELYREFNKALGVAEL